MLARIDIVKPVFLCINNRIGNWYNYLKDINIYIKDLIKLILSFNKSSHFEKIHCKCTSNNKKWKKWFKYPIIGKYLTVLHLLFSRENDVVIENNVLKTF